MVSYIRQYVLDPPVEIPVKRVRRKMKTFTNQQQSVRTQKSKVARLQKITRNLSKRLQQSGKYYDNILEFPLALCDEFGQMRDRHKSTFLSALTENFDFNDFVISPKYDFKEELEIIVDFLKYVHTPPVTELKTFGDYARFLWKQVVINHGFGRRANYVTIIIDKNKYLSPVRNIIHRERKSKTKKNDYMTCVLVHSLMTA